MVAAVSLCTSVPATFDPCSVIQPTAVEPSRGGREGENRRKGRGEKGGRGGREGRERREGRRERGSRRSRKGCKGDGRIVRTTALFRYFRILCNYYVRVAFGGGRGAFAPPLKPRCPPLRISKQKFNCIHVLSA